MFKASRASNNLVWRRSSTVDIMTAVRPRRPPMSKSTERITSGWSGAATTMKSPLRDRVSRRASWIRRAATDDTKISSYSMVLHDMEDQPLHDFSKIVAAVHAEASVDRTSAEAKQSLNTRSLASSTGYPFRWFCFWHGGFWDDLGVSTTTEMGAQSRHQSEPIQTSASPAKARCACRSCLIVANAGCYINPVCLGPLVHPCSLPA